MMAKWQVSVFFNKFINGGTTANMAVEEVKKVRLTNILGLIPMFMYLAYLLLGIANSYLFPVITCSVLILITLIGLRFNRIGNHSVAKNILLLANSAAVFITYNCLNIDFTILCYFFPLMMAFEILFDYYTERNYFVVALSSLILIIVACFVLPKGLFYYYQMSEELLQSSKLMNVLIPIIISVAFMLVIKNMHENSQHKLIMAKEKAEELSVAKTQFLSNMSHELRTPLNGIIGATNLLLHENITASQKRYFEIIHYSGEHMLNLINNILDFSKAQSGKMELDKNIFVLKHTLVNACNMFATLAHSAQINFIVEVDEKLNSYVLSDDLRLTQVMHNLLSNAFKFTAKGNVSMYASVINDTADKMMVRIKITDSGIGIKSEHQKKIFEGFMQADASTSRKYGGTGLGLSICSQILEKYNSKLVMSSEYGKGTTFEFDIEFEKAEEPPKEAEKIAAPEEVPAKKLSILVAEDNRVNMLVVKKILQRWNISVYPVANGLEAIEAVKKYTFDMVLLDLEMPEMDGHTAIAQIKQIEPDVPVIAFTAAFYDNMQEDLYKKGFNSYLLKPFSPDALQMKIKEFTGQ